jgi:cytidylate kinase
MVTRVLRSPKLDGPACLAVAHAGTSTLKRVRMPPKRSALTQRHLCVYGLSAAGKTTHAKLLAQQLGMDYVSASDLMFYQIGYKDTGNQEAWLIHADHIRQARESGLADKAVNKQLLERAQDPAPAIFDSWTLPYMARDSESLREYVSFLRIDSDLSSRALKCLVSQGANTTRSIRDATELIRSKDKETRDLFQSLFGFDIFKSVGTKNLKSAKVDISACVFGSSPRQVRRGIRFAHQAVTAAIPYVTQFHPEG